MTKNLEFNPLEIEVLLGQLEIRAIRNLTKC